MSKLSNADIVYISIKRDTRKFANKLINDSKLEALELDMNNETTEMTKEFLFIVPSYQENVFPDLYDLSQNFLETGNNIELCKGIIGTGNLNFAELYCVTAKDLSNKYNIPVVYKLEMQGSKVDVVNVREGLLKNEK